MTIHDMEDIPLKETKELLENPIKSIVYSKENQTELLIQDININLVEAKQTLRQIKINHTKHRKIFLQQLL